MLIASCPEKRCLLTFLTLQLSQDQDPTKNQWDQVDDFKWLKADHSPNWAILPEEERLSEDIWNGTVKGRPGLGPKDILRETGVLVD